MSKQFNKDLAVARVVEELVKNTLAALTTEYTFKNVGDQPQYFHKGDIMALGENQVRMIEVKNDSRIHETHNILCEEENYFKEGGYYAKGNMYSDYDIYCVVSQAERKMYFFDFKVIRDNYKRYGEFKFKNHYDQESYFYTLPIGRVKQLGGLIRILEY